MPEGRGDAFINLTANHFSQESYNSLLPPFYRESVFYLRSHTLKLCERLAIIKEKLLGRYIKPVRNRSAETILIPLVKLSTPFCLTT